MGKRGANAVAIIGMACRFPGAVDRRAYWRNLLDGVEALSRFTEEELLEAGNDPAEVTHPDYVKAAFLLPEPDHFDAGFFGYSPHEARLTDPQQRLMLEVSWEAFEDAGVVPGQHLGPVGVYAATGSVVTNYMVNTLRHHPDAMGHTASVLHIGNDKDFASTRVSFKLDLTGPSMNVQTACSTSMVLVDLARRAIGNGDCDMALVAAATMRVPHLSGYLNVKGAVFSPDGHIRAFDAEAGGTHFASGVAAVLVKDLDKAIADGDPIHGVIRGTAVNNDGARKASYAGTSVRGQTDVMTTAIARSGVDPDTLGYVECHGTGTVVGDPREFTAVKKALGDGPPGVKRPMGSVKPNIGHSEQSAGLASLIKTTLALKEGVVPPTINFSRPNPRMKLEETGFVINGAPLDYPLVNGEGPRRALINALGIGGTNAAAVLEQAPGRRVDGPASTRRAEVFALSAKSPEALEATVARHRAWLLEHPEADLGDLCHTLAVGRSHFDYRMAVVAGSVAELVEALDGFTADRRPARSSRLDRKIGFLFSGQGAQMAGMGKDLYETEPVFRAALDDAVAALDPHLDRPLLSVLFPEDAESAGLIDQTAHTQPALFAVEHALAVLVDSWGLGAEAVVGHSVGEFAATRVAGVLSLEAAAKLIATRGRLMQALPEGGAMAALLTGEAEVQALLDDLGRSDLAIAAVNGPAATVLSGSGPALGKALALAEARGVAAKRLTVSHAFHSPLMDPMLDDLRAAAAGGETPAAPRLPWISTYTGLPMDGAPEADYWPEQARGAVRYAQAVQALVDRGITDFIELGPGKSLLALGSSAASGEDLAWHASLSPAGDDGRRALELAAALYRRGYPVDWAGVNRGRSYQRLSLPTYAFQRERLWADDLPRSTNPTLGAAMAAGGDAKAMVSLVGEKLPLPPPEVRYRPLLGRGRQTWLADHRIHGALVLPTTAGLAAALRAARDRFGDRALEVIDFSHGAAMVLPEEGEREGHLALTLEEDADRGTEVRFALSSRPLGEEESWRAHMDGFLRPLDEASQAPGAGGKPRFNADATRRRCSLALRAERYYATIRPAGLDYGPAFQGIQSLWRGEGEALARVRVPDSLEVMLDGVLHPALLDACLHLYPAVLDGLGDFTAPPPAGALAALPLSMERFFARPTNERELWVHARRRPGGDATLSVVDVEVFDRESRPIAAFEGLTVKVLSPTLFHEAKAGEGAWLYRPRWSDGPFEEAGVPSEGPSRWLILGGDRDGLGLALAKTLGASEDTSIRHVPGDRVPRDRAAAAALLTEIAAEGDAAGDGRGLGIVHLIGPDSGPLGAVDWAEEAPQRAVLETALLQAQAIGDTRDRHARSPKLWFVTRGAMPATSAQPPCDVLQAGLWGMGRSLSLEAPAAWGGLVDLEPGGRPEADAALLARQLRSGEGENQVAFRGGMRRVARLVPSDPPPQRPRRDAPGGYLVTGGLGALGVETAEWIARNRAEPTLILVSRRGADTPNASAVKARLEGLGARVVLAKADLSRAGDLTRLMADLRAMDPPVRGIYHSAGVLDDGMADGMTWERFRKALAPKLDAAWMLHRESRGMALDDFVLYSSILSVIGSGGQTNYTAGNACLDALAAHRRALGLPAQSVNWGPWADAGLADGLGERGEAIWKSRGMEYIPPVVGREAFDVLFDGSMTQGVVALADWSLFLRQFETPPAFYAELVASDGEGAGLADDFATLRARLEGEDPGDRRAALTGFLASQAATTLGMGQAPDPEKPLREMGLDSLMAVTLINRVEAATGTRIPAAKLIQGPSIAQLIDEVWPDLSGVEPVASAPAAQSAVALDADGDLLTAPPKPTARPTPKAPDGRGGEPREGRRAKGGKGSWLMPITPREAPRFRLFCFPFAGGGSAAFQTWASQTDPSIEMYAVEPPGRLARIDETPVRDMDVFVRSVIDEMDGLLDVPFALFGHCLGGLTLYETARRLVDSGRPRPRHLFCSGARPPDRVRIVGPFERRLAKHLAGLRDYQPLVPAYRQSDAVFSSIIRQFDMAATDQFLGDDELRALMLPAVRAEFEMTTNYKYRPRRPWDIPITCFISRGDPYVSREDILGWGRFTNSRLQVHMREGTHYSIFEDAAFIQRVIARELSAPPS